MPLFPDQWFNELLSKSDIVEIASQYVKLSPKGQRFWGCCPFHSEKTPSFSVSRDRQLYYCFGCHAGGNVVGFVMELEKLTFVEAVKFLAQRAGMELPSEVDDEKLRRERAEKDRLYSACVEAARFYHTVLLSDEGEAARKYLSKRSLDGKICTRFGLGYAPNEWERLRTHLKSKGFTDSELHRAGLTVKGKKDGSYYDAYRGRVIFPIIGADGRVIAFGARTMGDDVPKYINTGDTQIYSKGNNVYGLNLMKGKHPTDFIMVEGYMDVISLHRAGVDNAVACLGTALTQQQARLMKRYVGTVYICYDGDSAGQTATIRGLEILGKEGLTVRVMTIPGGMDPDDYVKKHGKEAFLSLKDAAMTLNGFKLANIASRYDLSTPNGREEYVKEASAFTGTLQPVEQERYCKIIAQKSGMSISAVKAQLGLAAVAENSGAKKRNNRNEKAVRERNIREKAELKLIACMLKSKKAAMAALAGMEKNALRFTVEGLDELSGRILLVYAENEQLDAVAFVSGLNKDEAAIFAAAEAETDSVVDAVSSAAEYVRAILRIELEQEFEKLGREITEQADPEKRAELLMKISQTSRKLREIK